MSQFLDETKPLLTTPPEKPNWLKRLYKWVLHWADTKYGLPALILIASSCTTVPVAAQTRPVTIDDVLDLKAVGAAFNGGAPAMSPDGSAVLFTVRTWRDRALPAP